MGTGRGLVRALAFAAAWLVTVDAFAQPALERLARLDEFFETRWSTREGAPGDVQSIAQSSDGYLWFVTDRGLVRFDGIVFRRFVDIAGPGQQLQSPTVSFVSATPDGLWIGYRFGGLSLLHDGRVTHYTVADGLPTSTTMSALRGREQRLWVCTAEGLYRQDGKRFRKIGQESGLPEHSCYAQRIDNQGTLWTTDDDGIFRLAPGEQRFEKVLPSLRIDSSDPILFLAPDGRAWGGIVQQGHGRVGPLPLRGEDEASVEGRWLSVPDFGSATFRPDGVIWLATSQGARAIDPAHPDANPVAEKRDPTAPVDDLGEIFVDRESNVWAGGVDGAISYRPTKLASVPIPAQTHVTAARADDAGSMWVTGGTAGLVRLAADGSILEKLAAGAQGQPITTLHRSPAGVLWLANPWGVWRLDEGRLEGLGMPANVIVPGEPPNDVQAMATDDTGEPWMSINSMGVYQRVGGAWVRYGGRKEIPHEVATAMATDAKRRLWLGYVNGRVLRLDHADSPKAIELPRLPVGTVLSIHDAGERTWIGGDAGLVLLDAQGVHLFGDASVDGLPGATGIVQTADGDLWLSTTTSITRISASEIEATLAHPGHRPELQRLTYLDGRRGTPEGLHPLPTLLQAGDGRLWFAQRSILMTLMPGHVRTNTVVPPVVIETIEADGGRVLATPDMTLPERTRELRITFTALSLAISRRVQFRYRLDGQDVDWHGPSADRSATYTNLPPGRYVFHVLAANDDGLWNETGARLSFTIPAAWWQTSWFRFLCLIAAASVLWMLHRWRLHLAAVQAQVRLRVRHAERERIARELHDTLLQSTQGLILGIQAATSRLPEADDVRQDIEARLDSADAVVGEARDRVLELRKSMAGDSKLLQGLTAVGADFEHDGAVSFQAANVGEPRALAAVVSEEIFLVACEALRNAFAHGQADHIDVEVNYERRALRIVISDDGRGIEAPVLAAGARAGHWGLPGMRERARQIGAAVSIVSRRDAGTRVELVVPASVAYARRAPPWWRRQWAGRE